MLVDGQKYKVNLETFQGPLDLLLHLIESRKMHICDISLSQITDDYINYLQQLKEFSIRASADFILTASILMLIKSKSILPSLDLSVEEEQSIEELETRLKEYQKIKRLSIHIKSSFGNNVIFFRQPEKRREIIFSPDKNTNIENIYFSIRDVLKNIPQKIITPKVIIDKVISLEEVIDNLSERIKSSLKISFNKFSGRKNNGDTITKEDKVNIVISFLAMLELVKQGTVAVKQEYQFGDIDINTQEVNIPNYL
ncbi:MAG: segregation/condensation protein A [Candidatus Pacebacteria bacterium]|nr:segregation/condensation protein A [Candidatus Paceibacterota bacterium]